MRRNKIYLKSYEQKRIYKACEYLARGKCPDWLGKQRGVVASCDALFETGSHPHHGADQLCMLYAAFYDFDHRTKVFPNDCYIQTKPVKWATTARILALLLYLEIESDDKIEIPKKKKDFAGCFFRR